MYAVIETGAKQYRVQEGDVITVEKLNVAEGDKVTFDKVLVMGEGTDIQVGTPYLDAAVYGEAIENGKGDKVIIYKYKAKKDSHSKQGHRQPYTKVEITGIGEDKPKKSVPEQNEIQTEQDTAADQDHTDAKNGGVNMSMKKDELIAYAEAHHIEINKSATKQEIIDRINSESE